METPINYRKVARYFQKKWDVISTGIDTLVYKLSMNELQIQSAKENYSQYTLNTNVAYFKLSNYEHLSFQSIYTADGKGYAQTIIIYNDQFALPGLQIYVNNKVQKLTAYGLFFRLCQLVQMDPFLLIDDICDHFAISRQDALYRGDYKIDILGQKPSTVLGMLYERNRSFSARNQTIISKKWELETIYIGAKGSNYAYARMYNKSIDTDKKVKGEFYADYPNPTTRIEVQTGPRFCGTLTLAQWLEKVRSYMGDDHADFDGPYFIGKRYNPDWILNNENFRKRVENSLIKGAKNGLDLSKEFARASQAQPFYDFICTKKTDEKKQ